MFFKKLEKKEHFTDKKEKRKKIFRCKIIEISQEVFNSSKNDIVQFTDSV